MTVKQDKSNKLFSSPRNYIGDSNLSIREAAKGFLLSLKASNSYAAGSLQSLETGLALLVQYAETQDWPGIQELTTSHMEEYLAYLQVRPRWFGERDKAHHGLSEAYIEGSYRRIKRFFNWLVERGHRESNPLDLIRHPHVTERVVATVSEREMLDLLRWLDFQPTHLRGRRFWVARARALLYLLWDTPARRNELMTLTMDAVDLDGGGLRVMGKGRRERWMPLGDVATEALWEYIQARAVLKPATTDLWVSSTGKACKSQIWMNATLKRLGERAGVPHLHTHRFRHSYAMNALRAKMPEQMLRVVAGWKKIPETYFRTLATEDVARVHREMSPADKLWRARETESRKRQLGKSRGRL